MLQRYTAIASLYAGTSAALSLAGTTGAAGVVAFGNFAGGQVYVPTGSSITALAWYASYDGATFTPVYDGAGNAVTSTIAATENCLIPAACFACLFLMAVASGGAGTVVLSLKS